MRTQPQDLNEDLIVGALARYLVRPTAMEYSPGGFGSHHWQAANAEAHSFFLTVDDLDAKLSGAHDTYDAVFGRLSRAFATVKALRDTVGLSFVVAPLAAQDGSLVQRLTDRHTLAVFPRLDGRSAGDNGEFTSNADRFAVRARLTDLHKVDAKFVPQVRMDDFVVPNRAELMEAMDRLGRPWRTGPHGEWARALLASHSREVVALLDVYDRLAAELSTERERMVITHGEPRAANVIIVSRDFYLVDWDTVLLGLPERDLAALGGGEKILQAYQATTGTAVRQEGLDLYRNWFDLAEISGYIRGFRAPHVESADSAESWRNLVHFLRPRARWPGYLDR